MEEPVQFSWLRHLSWLVTDDLPTVALMLLALIFEFDNGPLENWWMGRHMGYPWSECVQHHRRRLVRAPDQRLPAKLVAKLALVTIGPLVVFVDLISVAFLDWSHCQEINRLLFSWGRVGAVRGVPE